MKFQILRRFKKQKDFIRQSWDKLNYYVLHHVFPRRFNLQQTLYQKRFLAKKELRAYHGSNITEKQFKQMFKDYCNMLPSEQPFLKAYTSGNIELNSSTNSYNRSTRGRTNTSVFKNTRIGAQVLMCSPLERRLDTIIFRTHLASSIFKAAELVRTGKVSVNGETIKQAFYQAKELDVIQVEPQAVETLVFEYNSDKTTIRNIKFMPNAFSEPFLFLPNYLEVDYATCSIVFLRAPKFSNQNMEIPSPCPPHIHTLAYEFYLQQTKST